MRWFRDTLFLRLFILMWVALVASHIAAFGIVTSGFLSAARPPDERPRPIFPSLPPTPGIPGDEYARGRPPPGSAALRPAGEGVPALPTPLLVIDYLIRLVVIGAAAALGARWLARPVRRLVDAAQALGPALGNDTPLPLLDEASGTLEVREAARVFNRMARELDAQFRARGLLMAALSHDLRTPLTRMRMRLEAEDEAVFVQRCIADIRAMSEIVETALEVFRSSDADEPLRAVDVESLLRSMADDLAEGGQTVAFDGGPAVALARPVALRRVVANLLGNAMRYAGGAEIGVGADGERVRVTIDDRGPGIPPELLEAVFQPFFRVEGSRNRASGGSGLGLYIARDLLRRQGGELTLINRPGGGLRAEFFLARAR